MMEVRRRTDTTNHWRLKGILWTYSNLKGMREIAES
jgi:hypothetical protein